MERASPFFAGFQGTVDGLIDIVDLHIQVAGLQPLVDPPFFHFRYNATPSFMVMASG
jgi:hypothetical protein